MFQITQKTKYRLWGISTRSIAENNRRLHLYTRMRSQLQLQKLLHNCHETQNDKKVRRPKRSEGVTQNVTKVWSLMSDTGQIVFRCTCPFLLMPRLQNYSILHQMARKEHLCIFSIWQVIYTHTYYSILWNWICNKILVWDWYNAWTVG